MSCKHVMYMHNNRLSPLFSITELLENKFQSLLSLLGVSRIRFRDVRPLKCRAEPSVRPGHERAQQQKPNRRISITVIRGAPVLNSPTERALPHFALSRVHFPHLPSSCSPLFFSVSCFGMLLLVGWRCNLDAPHLYIYLNVKQVYLHITHSQAIVHVFVRVFVEWVSLSGQV